MGWDANESRPSGHGDPIKNLADEDMRLNRRQVLPDDGVAEEKAEHRPRVTRRLEDDPLDLSRLHWLARFASVGPSLVRKSISRSGKKGRNEGPKHGRPSAAKGGFGPPLTLGRPNPGASRRLCPGRDARALRISSSRKTLDETKPGENRWNCVASIPAS